MTATPPRLYHWTCYHHAPTVRVWRTVTPHMGLSWWTDLGDRSKRTRAATGLTSRTLDCDRMEYRCTATRPDLLTPWLVWRVDHQVAPGHVELLEAAPGARPDHWWVSPDPVQVGSVRRMVA